MPCAILSYLISLTPDNFDLFQGGACKPLSLPTGGFKISSKQKIRISTQVWRFEKAGHNLRSEVVQDIQDDVDRWRHHHHHHYVDRCRHHLLHQRRIHLCNCNHHQHHRPPLLSMKQIMVSKHLARAPEHQEVLLPNQSDSDEDFLFEVVDQDKLIR